MAYSDHYKLADDLIEHLDIVFRNSDFDPFIQSRYTGFLAVSVVAVLELSLREIFCNYASEQHEAFGRYCAHAFKHTNARIKLDQIREHLIPFGEDRITQFVTSINEADARMMNETRTASLKGAYKNLIRWRNDFAHAGQVPQNATYNEVKQAYNCGKIIMECLAEAMQ